MRTTATLTLMSLALLLGGCGQVPPGDPGAPPVDVRLGDQQFILNAGQILTLEPTPGAPGFPRALVTIDGVTQGGCATVSVVTTHDPKLGPGLSILIREGLGCSASVRPSVALRTSASQTHVVVPTGPATVLRLTNDTREVLRVTIQRQR